MKLLHLKVWLMAVLFIATAAGAQSIPELVFQNPTWVATSAPAGTDGAEYLFKNVAPGLDAKVKIRNRSAANVILTNIDVSNMGWTKAFQPQVGIPGNVPINTTWWMNFELTFLKAGTNDKKKISSFVITSIDTDGDGYIIKEFLQLEKIKNVKYCPVTYLVEGTPMTTASVPAGLAKCGECGNTSPLVTCSNCSGSGLNSGKECGNCKGSGKLHDECDHAWQSTTAPLTGYNATGIDKYISGPVQNFTDIDTLSTPTMATYEYENKDVIRFTVGAKSGSKVSNAGERLNSLWFKSFKLVVPGTLPVRLSAFTAAYDKQNVVLDWTTEREESFSHYVVERSTDGKSYTDIATIAANGNTTQKMHYQYKDANLTSATGMAYYRLRLVEKTNDVNYSQVRTVRLSGEAESLKLAAYPNPVKDVVKLTLPQSWQGKKIQIDIYNSTGGKLQSLPISAASQTESLNIGGMANGVYVVTVKCDDRTLQERIVKN